MPLVGVAGSRHVGANQHGRSELAGDRVSRGSLPGGIERGLIQQRRPARIVPLEDERCRVRVREPVRRGPGEAQAVVERQATIDPPAVLRKPFEQIDDVARRRSIAALAVGPEHAERGVRIRIPRVQRIVRRRRRRQNCRQTECAGPLRHSYVRSRTRTSGCGCPSSRQVVQARYSARRRHRSEADRRRSCWRRSGSRRSWLAE